MARSGEGLGVEDHLAGFSAPPYIWWTRSLENNHDGRRRTIDTHL